jgi:hypothetical protein
MQMFPAPKHTTIVAFQYCYATFVRFGTLPTWRDVRLDSVLRSKAEIGGSHEDVLP